MGSSKIFCTVLDGGDAIGASILLTGATGFLGTQIALRLVRNTDHAIVALVRSKGRDDALHRLTRIWWDWPDLVRTIGRRVEVVAGDVSEPRLGLSNDEYNSVVHRVTHIVHTAADLRLDGPIDDLRRTNVDGTGNILELARAARHDHGLACLSHVSTAYVAGRRSGAILEDSLTDQCGFHNSYELSKYEAEVLVQKARGELPISVFRPGMVVGDSRTGETSTFNAAYLPLRLYLQRRPFLIPVHSSLRFNIVPVDYVADAIVTLTFAPQALGLSFHLTAPGQTLPTAREFVYYLRSWAGDHLGMRLAPPLFVPMPAQIARAFYRVRGTLNRGDRSTLAALLAVVPYFNEHKCFLRHNTDRLLGDYDFRWREVTDRVMDFAVAKAFVHRPADTVHERLLSRLRSKTLPVTYHDLIEGKVVTHETRSVRDEVLTAAAAMQQMGIRMGDRAALVGPNSTRYLTIDAAIGVCGAVSVPIYSTSPPAEISQILCASQPKLFFVGSPGIIERLDEVAAGTPVVSFSRRAPKHPPAREVIPWETFLAAACGAKATDRAPVSFSDMATVRYTSGTGGSMKGACFDHANLRWMAQSVCTVMNSWRAMNAEVSYLSYLPMNHVVEGILTGYSPYYSPAAFNIFFLEDINDLPTALRKVRPHIFFSVPRFYEKVWQALMTRSLGRFYLNFRPGMRRRLLGQVLRRIILHKAGLDRCGQLVVGSAPSSDQLLRNFRELGIEIYNAYGLTEAPLAAMNRLGANRLGTVGEPLPETELHFADDGELLIRGPQVARGYLNGDTCEPFGDHVLCTGDLGYVTEESSLVLHGRKREIMVTAYGKNVDPLKIESMLRTVPGVNEALVLGEGRPFCAAILWVTGDTLDEQSWLAMERAILEVNRSLSHPEQIKRWAFLRGQLSVEAGDMTASLKLKRRAVTSRLANTVEALYGKLPAASGDILRVGGADGGEQPNNCYEPRH